jgi:hypothetical protein
MLRRTSRAGGGPAVAEDQHVHAHGIPSQEAFGSLSIQIRTHLWISWARIALKHETTAVAARHEMQQVDAAGQEVVTGHAWGRQRADRPARPGQVAGSRRLSPSPMNVQQVNTVGGISSSPASSSRFVTCWNCTATGVTYIGSSSVSLAYAPTSGGGSTGCSAARSDNEPPRGLVWRALVYRRWQQVSRCIPSDWTPAIRSNFRSRRSATPSTNSVRTSETRS